MINLTRNQLILIAAGTSAASLIGAYIFQALGYPPCQLCFWQRYPHMAAVGIGALALLIRGPVLPWLGAVAAATTSAIGGFHSGVERKWWPGPDACSISGVEGLSADELMSQIMNAPLVRCDEIPWRVSDLITIPALEQVLDISMANLNFVGSAVLVLVWIMAARR